VQTLAFHARQAGGGRLRRGQGAKELMGLNFGQYGGVEVAAAEASLPSSPLEPICFTADPETFLCVR
jgi:hypothetical protein